MRHFLILAPLLATCFAPVKVVAAEDDMRDREAAAGAYMATFCVTDVGLRPNGGTTNADGTTHIFYVVANRDGTTSRRNFDLSQAELHAMWRTSYAEALSRDELVALATFCRPDNEPLRTALKKQRGREREIRHQAILKHEPLLAAHFASAFPESDLDRNYALTPEEGKALTELRESAVAQAAVRKVTDVVRKKVDAQVWQIGKERGQDTLNGPRFNGRHEPR